MNYSVAIVETGSDYTGYEHVFSAKIIHIFEKADNETILILTHKTHQPFRTYDSVEEAINKTIGRSDIPRSRAQEIVNTWCDSLLRDFRLKLLL